VLSLREHDLTALSCLAELIFLSVDLHGMELLFLQVSLCEVMLLLAVKPDSMPLVLY